MISVAYQDKNLPEKATKKKLFQNILVLMLCLSLSILLAVFTITGIVRLTLTNIDSGEYVKVLPLTMVVLPEDSNTKKLTRERPKPKEDVPPKSLTIPKQPDLNIKPVNLIKPIKMTSFNPSLSFSNSFRIDPGKFAVSGPARGLIPVYRVPPQYPYKASQRGIEGLVELEFTITEEGTVKNIKVVKETPPHVFDRAAIQAISRWRFTPSKVAGRAVEQRAIQEIKFQLNRN